MKKLLAIIFICIQPLLSAAYKNGDHNMKFNFKTKTVKLNSGYEMPLNGLGTYSLQGDACSQAVSYALQNGYRLIDTAYMYSNEESIGKGIKQSGVPREEIFITTKLYMNQYSNAEKAIDEALKKLNTDYIDLMLLHHPGNDDIKAYKAMEQAVRNGKIKSIGLSNWYIKELESFLPKVEIMPAVIQNEIHPYYQDRDVINYIHNKGITVEGWYPLGGRGRQDELMNDKTLKLIADKHKKSIAQVILRWNLQNGVIVIPGTSNKNHIKENTNIYDFELTDEDMKLIESLDRNEKHDWY